MNYGVVILGAGASRRMGRAKLTLPWRGSTVIDGIVQQWRELDATQLVIVVSNDSDELRAALDDIGFAESHRILNPDPERGMFSSIRVAAQWSGWALGNGNAGVTPPAGCRAPSPPARSSQAAARQTGDQDDRKSGRYRSSRPCHIEKQCTQAGQGQHSVPGSGCGRSRGIPRHPFQSAFLYLPPPHHGNDRPSSVRADTGYRVVL